MGECQDFPSKVFCLTVLKTFAGESFTVAIFSGIQKVWLRGVEYREFPSKYFLSQNAESFCRGALLRCVSESFR